MGRAKRKVFRPIFGRDLTSSAGRRTQEQADNSFRAAQQLYDINAEKYRASAIRSLGDSLEGLNEAEKQIAIDKAIANIMPKGENPFADISSNPNTEGAIQKDEERAKAGAQVDYGLLDKAEVWMNASMNKLLANATQSVKAGSDVIRGASDYFFSGNDVSPNYMLSESVEREGKGALYSIFGAGNKYLAETAEFADRAIQAAEASLASRGMDSGFWHAVSDMVGQWGFTYGGMATAALGRLGGAFSGLGSLSKSVTAAARWAKASEYTRKMFSASSLFYGALSEAAVESYGVSKALEEAKGSQLAQLRSMMQKDFDQDFYSYEHKYGAIKFSDFADTILASSGMDPRLKREVASVLSGESKNPSASAVAAANAIVSQYKDHAEKAILQNASDEIDQRNGLAAGWTAGLNTVLLTFMNKYTYELATDKLAGANRLRKAGRFGALGSTLINASAEGIEEVVQGGISKGAENIGKRSVDEMLRASTISERNSTSIGVLGSIGEIGKGMWDTTLSASAWTDEALPAIVSTLLMPMYKGSKFANDSHRTDAFGDARQTKKSWLSKLYDGSPIGISGVERYRDYKYSGGKQRTSDEAIEAMTKMIKGKHDDLTNEEKRVMTEVFGQNYAEVVHETYQSVVDAMASADRMNALLARVAQSTTVDSADVEAAEELTKAHNVATMLSVIYNSSIGQANFDKRNFSQWTSDMMRSTREFGADMGHAVSSFFSPNNEAKEARYQAAVAKREADKAAREEARRSESDPFAEVPDNLRPFLNFLDVKETDEATLVSIARQRIDNTLDPEEKKKMQEAYFQGEGSNKLTEKAIKDIAGEINKQKHTLADIATDYSNTRRFLDLTSKPGEFSGREKSRVAAAAASFNHLRRLASEHLDAMEGEVAGLYKEISDAAESRMSELLKDREAMRDNLNTDDEQRKSQLEANIEAINQEIAALEREMRHIEEMQKKNQERGKQNYSNTLGGWEEFMKRFEDFNDLSSTYIRAAFIAGNEDLANRLKALAHDEGTMSENGKLAIKFAKEAMAGIESLNKMLEDKKARENLVARATEEEEKKAEVEGEEIVDNGEPIQAVEEAEKLGSENGVTSETTQAMRKGAEKAIAKTEPGTLSLSQYKSAVHDTIKSILLGSDRFMDILSQYGLDNAASEKFIEDFIRAVNDFVGTGSVRGYSDYRHIMRGVLSNLMDRTKHPGLDQTIFGFQNNELIDSVSDWVYENIDKFPEDPTTPIKALPSEQARPKGDEVVDSIEFDQATQKKIEFVSVGGVTILNSRMSSRIQGVFWNGNAIADMLRNGNAKINTSITFADGKATISVSISTDRGTYTFSIGLDYDDLRNRLQTDVSLSVLASDIVDIIFDANEKTITTELQKVDKEYTVLKEAAEKNEVKAGEGQSDDNAPLATTEKPEVKTSKSDAAATSNRRTSLFDDIKKYITRDNRIYSRFTTRDIDRDVADKFIDALSEYLERALYAEAAKGRSVEKVNVIMAAIKDLLANESRAIEVFGFYNEDLLNSFYYSPIFFSSAEYDITIPSVTASLPQSSETSERLPKSNPEPPAPPVSSDGSATLVLPKVESLTLWDAYNPGLNKANLAELTEEWQERMRKWYEEKNIGLNLKNAKGKEIFFGFTEELSENGDISNSPLVIYVKDEQEQFVPIGLLPSKTSGNTQALINNARVVATEDKKFNIFSSSDLNAPKTTVSKVKYSDFNRTRVVGKKTVNAQTIENAVEEELKRGQVAISVTAFPVGKDGVEYSITTHNDSLAEESEDAINALLTEKKNLLKENYGQTYFVVVTNGKNGPKPILVGVKGKNSFVELIQGKAGNSEASSLASEYMDKLAEKFDEAKTNGTNGVGVSISVDPDRKYVHEFGDSFVRSIRIEEEGKVRIFFSKRLYDKENPTALMDVDVVLDQNLKTTKEQIAEAIVRAMKAIGIHERRIAVPVEIMTDKEKLESFLKRNMRMTNVRSESGFEALSDEKGNEEGNNTTPEPVSPPHGPEGTTTEGTDPSLKPIGRKQIEKAKARLANAKDENDTIDAIAEFERNVSRGAEATDEDIRLFDEAKLELKEKGYELISPVGQTYKEGMNVIVENIELDETLPPGKEIISYVASPQVNKDGKMIRAAKVHLKISPYEEGEEATTIPQGTAPKVSEAAVGKPGKSDGLFGSATEDALDKIKGKLAEDLANQGYDTVVKSSTSPHIAAVDNGRIYMFEINPNGTYNKVEWSQMHPTLKADAFALINSALSSDFKSSKNGRLLKYGEEMSGTTHTIVVRRSTKGMSTGGKKKSSGSNADRIVRLAGEEKHVAAHAIKTEPTLRGLVLELAAKGVSSGTPIYFSEHTINGKTYGGGHKVVLQAEDEHGNVHSVEVEIDNELGAQMDKIAEDVRELSARKVAEGFAMISDVKTKDINSDRIDGEADIIFLRNDGEKGEGIVADIKSTLIASETSSPAKNIRESSHNGVQATTKYKTQIDGYETYIKTLGFKIAEQGYVIAVGYATSNGATVVEAMSLDEKDLNQHRRQLNRGTRVGSNGLNSNDQTEANPKQDRAALLPFERGDVYREAHDVAKLLPQGMLYQALRIYRGVAEVTPDVWGRYRNGVLEVAEGASAGTLYHEAMHFIYEKLLTDADRGMLVSGLSEVTEEQIRETFGNQIPVAYAHDVQELSAELFRLWMQTKGDKKARKALEEKITRLAPKKKGFWGRLQALWERIKAALGYTPQSSIISVLTGIEGGNYSHVSVASRVNATNLSSPMEGVVESMLRYGLMSEEEFNSSYDPSSIMASRNLAQLVHRKLMELAYEALKDLEEDKIETDHAGNIRRMEGTLDDAIAVLRDAAANSEDAMHAVEIIDELGIDGDTKTIQEMDALEERTDNLLGQTLAGCR